MSEAWTVFEFRDYKEALEASLKARKAKDPSLSQRSLAQKIKVQPTYLSRVMNSQSSHLSEDQLYGIATALRLYKDEIDFLLLLRAHATTEVLARKDEIFAQIESISTKRRTRANAVGGDSELSKDLMYLLRPICVIVHVSLFIKTYQKDPRQLCSKIGISANDLKEILKTLDATGYIVLDSEDPFTILKVESRRPHFTREHPYMRAHQSMLKRVMEGRLAQTGEESKEGMMVTFTANDQFILVLKDELQDFMKQIQKRAFESPGTQLYQLNFDFLKWF